MPETLPFDCLGVRRVNALNVFGALLFVQGKSGLIEEQRSRTQRSKEERMLSNDRVPL